MHDIVSCIYYSTSIYLAAAAAVVLLRQLLLLLLLLLYVAAARLPLINLLLILALLSLLRACGDHHFRCWAAAGPPACRGGPRAQHLGIAAAVAGGGAGQASVLLERPCTELPPRATGRRARASRTAVVRGGPSPPAAVPPPAADLQVNRCWGVGRWGGKLHASSSPRRVRRCSIADGGHCKRTAR